MKKFSIWLICTFSMVAALAQTVTINVQGNRNKQVSIDGAVYTLDPISTATGSRQAIVIDDLSTGQHTLEVVNTDANNDENNISTVFKLRSGYNMTITVRNNGTVQLKETRSTGSLSGHPAYNKTPMSSTSFNNLLQSVKRQNSTRNRITMVTGAIAKSTNYFTSSQAQLLIAQISSQAGRLQSLKSIYPKVVDAQNFSQLYTLLNTQAGKDELVAHINTTNYGTASTSSHNAYMSAMSDASFNTIFQKAQSQWQAGLRLNYIIDQFSNTSNYFTSNQARQLIQLVPEENNRLILAKTAYRGIVDASNFSQVSDLLTSYSSRTELQNYINSYKQGSVYNYRTPMSESSFSAIYNDVQDEYALGAKFNALKNVFANSSYYFTTSQARRLVMLVSSESNRLELAKAAYDNISDPANFSLMYDVLSSQASRNELSAFVSGGNYGTTTPVVNVAMSAETYNKLYSSVQNTWGFGAKMNSLTNIFANTTYFFTTEQAKRLIELVSAESNRLTLAKAAYKQVVDQQNFSQLYTILSSQSSRDELDAYIKSL